MNADRRTGLAPALRTEYRKTVTTRMWWILLLCSAGYQAFLGAMMAFVLTFDPESMTTGMGGEPMPPMPALDRVLTVYTLAPSLGYVFPLVIGAMMMTGEFRHQTITPTLLAEPRRTLMLGAKLVAALPVGVLFGIGGTLGTVLGGAPVFALMGEPALLTDPEVLRTLARSVLALTVWTAVGVGFGSLVTNQVAVIVALLGWTQLVEPMVRLLLGTQESLAGVTKFLPGAAGEAIAGSSFYASTGLADLLSVGGGTAVLVGYALVFAALGRLTTLRRDIT